MKLVLSGAPSVGKTTQGRRLAEWLGVPHISSGELIRAGAAAGNADAIAMLQSTADGSLAPSGAIIHLVMSRLSIGDCGYGYVLDGFPRKIEEAEALCDSEYRPEMFVALKASEVVLMHRLLTRAAVAGRADDDPAVFPRRVAVYRRETELVTNVMRDFCVPVLSVDAEFGPDAVQSTLRSIIPDRAPHPAPAL